MKTKLMHVRANVSDLKRAIEWYESVLGFETEMGWPLDKPTYMSFKSQDGGTFSILEEKETKSYGRFNFSVDNVDELWEKLKDKVEVIEPLFDTPWGTRKFTIKDLDGNELGFGNG